MATRQQAKDFLITLGIAEPTDEQVTNYLNQVGSETKREKDRAEAYKTDANKAAELQKQLDEINNANLTEIERANKATEEANNRVAEMEKQIKIMQLKSDLATNGIVGESADKLIESISGGTFDASLLGQIITDREKSAVANYEKQKLASTPNPDGGSGEDKETKPVDVENAENLVFGNSAPSQEQKDFYKL